MSNGNWLKLNRELFEKPIWLNSTAEQKVVLIAILGMVNHAPMEWEWKGEKYSCKPGQKITSLPKIVEQCGKGITIQNVRTALKRFEKLGFLTDESTEQGRLITVVNWGKYQHESCEPNRQPNRRLTDDQQTANRRLTSNKNNKNDKKDKNIPYGRANKSPLAEVVETMPEELQPTIWRFVRHRTTLQAPISRDGLEELLKRLIKISNSNVQEADEILRQSIANGWKMIKPLEKQNNTVSLMDRIRAGEFDE